MFDTHDVFIDFYSYGKIKNTAFYKVRYSMLYAALCYQLSDIPTGYVYIYVRK